MRLRRSIQILSLALFFFLFFTATYRLTGIVPHDLYLRADPLAGLLILVAVPLAVGSFGWDGQPLQLRLFCAKRKGLKPPALSGPFSFTA